MLGLAGIALAYRIWVQRPDHAGAHPASGSPAAQLFVNKWYFDELIDVVDRPARSPWFGRFGQQTFERVFVDRALVGGTTGIVRAGSPRCARCSRASCASTPRCSCSALVVVALYFLAVV